MIDLTAYMADALKRNITRNYGVPMPSNAPTLRFANIFQQALNEPVPKKSTNPLLARIEELENRIKELNEMINKPKEEPEEEENELPSAEFSEEKKKEPPVAKKKIEPQPTEFQPDMDVLARISEKYFGVNPYSGKEKEPTKPSGITATVVDMRKRGMSDDEIRNKLVEDYTKKGLDRDEVEAFIDFVLKTAPTIG